MGSFAKYIQRKIAEICTVEVRHPLYVGNLEDFLEYSSDFLVVNPRVLRNRDGQLILTQLLYASLPNERNLRFSVIRYFQSYGINADYLFRGDYSVISELEELALRAKRTLETFGKKVVISKTKIEKSQE